MYGYILYLVGGSFNKKIIDFFIMLTFAIKYHLNVKIGVRGKEEFQTQGRVWNRADTCSHVRETFRRLLFRKI